MKLVAVILPELLNMVIFGIEKKGTNGKGSHFSSIEHVPQSAHENAQVDPQGF